MAGMTAARSFAPPRPVAGMTYDPARGGYVSQGTLDRDRLDSAAATAPQYMTDPTGMVHQYNAANGPRGTWDPIGAAGSTTQQSQMALGDIGASRAAAARPAAAPQQDNSAMLAKLEQLWRSPVQEPAHPGRVNVGDESEAERAALTQAKERRGSRLQSGLKSLDALMASRGLSGSGIHGERLGELAGENEAQAAQTDRDLIFSRTGRARDVADTEYGANAAYQSNLGNFRLQARNQLQSLLSLYGMRY